MFLVPEALIRCRVVVVAKLKHVACPDLLTTKALTNLNLLENLQFLDNTRQTFKDE